MHHHRLHRIQFGLTILLLLTLPACIRSASTAMTPLPSAPPPTPTGIDLTPAPLEGEPATEPATEPPVASEEIFEPVEASPTESAEAETVTATTTATKASPATAVACGNALSSRLQTGSYAYVNPDPPLPNNLRSEAGQDNELLGVIQPGQAMKILDGPKCVDGSLWWKVSPLNSDLIGWTAEGDEQTYWLIPCSSEKECGS